MDLIIFGAGGHSKVIIEMIELLGFNILGVIEENSSKLNFRGYKIFKKNIDLPCQYIVAVGDNLSRKRIVSQLPSIFVNIIHPKAIISKSVKMGVGTVIMGGATINSDVTLGNHIIINTNSSVDHDCVLADFVHISPNAALAGNVKVGEGTHIGIGACVKQNITIGKWCIIGAGAVVINNVNDNSIVVGNPARALGKAN